MTRPKVLIVSPSTDTRVGGFERFSNLLRDALAPEFDTELIGATRASNRRPAAMSYMRDSQATAKAIAKLHQPDLIISGVTLGAGLDPSVPRIHVCHGTMLNNARSSRGEPFKARASTFAGGGYAEWRAARRARLVAVSETTAREMRSNLRTKSEITVIENGVDCDLFRPVARDRARTILGWRTEEKVALFVGRPEMRKGIDVAVASARASGFSLFLAGSRDYPGTHWLGLMDPEALALAYSASDCVIFPTRYEACSYTILEAIAAGAHLLTTEVGWMNDMTTLYPEAQEAIVSPTIGAYTRALSELPERRARFSALDAQLQQRVRTHNNIAAFAESWRSVCRATIGSDVEGGRC